MNPFPPLEKEFRKAAKSGDKWVGGESCVHVARKNGWVVVRDTKVPFGSANDFHLIFTDVQFDEFLDGIRSGRVDNHDVNVIRRTDGNYEVTNVNPQTALSSDQKLIFTQAEMDAFYDGVINREFDIVAFA